MIRDIVASIEDRSPRGIAAGVNRLISSGALPAGSRLPTVRELAAEMGTSPTTVAPQIRVRVLNEGLARGMAMRSLRWPVPDDVLRECSAHCPGVDVAMWSASRRGPRYGRRLAAGG
jgi:hypothetical protein